MNNEDRNHVIRQPDKKELFHEILRQRYLAGRNHIREAFERISLEDYILLFHLREKKKTDTEFGGRIYLSEIAEKMETTTSAASKMARALKERGFVTWSHDGKGEEGTYVELSPTGEELLKSQEQILQEYYSRVIDQYGTEKTLQLLQLTKEMSQVMSRVYKELEQEQNEKQAADGPAGDYQI